MRISTAIKCLLLGLVLVGIGVAMKAWQHYTDPGFLRLEALRLYAENGEGDLRLGRLELDGVTAVRAQGVALALPHEDTPLFYCPEIVAELDPTRLLKRRIIPRRVTLRSPVIRLIHSEADGKWNVQGLLPPERPPTKPPEGFLRDGLVLEDATVEVVCSEVFEGDGTRRTYSGLQLVARPQPDVTDPDKTKWMLDGEFHGGLFDGTRVSGWIVGGRASIRVDAAGLAVGERLWKMIPCCRRVWDDVHLTGIASCTVNMDRDVDESGEVTFGTTATCRIADGTANTTYYPMPLHSVTGVVEITDEALFVRDATGMVAAAEFADPATGPEPALVRMNGYYPFTRQPAISRIEVEALPLCRRSLETIPGFDRALLDQYAIAGRCQLDITVESPPDGESHARATCQLHHASLRMNGLDLPIEQISGTVAYSEDGVRLEALRGIMRQSAAALAPAGEHPFMHPAPRGGAPPGARAMPARSEGDDGPDGPAAGNKGEAGEDGVGGRGATVVVLSAEGLYDPDGKNTALVLQIEGLHTTEALLRAYPPLARLWELARPELDVNATLRLSSKPAPGKLDSSVVVDVLGGTLRPPAVPLPLTDVAGTIKIDSGTRIFIPKLGASVVTGRRHDPRAGPPASRVSLTGTADLDIGHYELFAAAENLPVNEALFRALPHPGPMIWDESHIEGIVSLRGKFLHDDRRRRIPTRFLLDADLKDASAAFAAAPVPITGLTGRLLIGNRQALSNNLAGIACGGRFEGAAVIYYGPAREKPSFGATASFRQVDLAKLVSHLSKEGNSPADAPGNGKEKPQPRVSGLLEGTIDLGGVVHGSIGTLARGHVVLTEADVWQMPFFVGLLPLLQLSIPSGTKVPGYGEATFSLAGGQITVPEFTFTGGGLSINGRGTVGLDGKLDISPLIAVSAKGDRTGIPIITPLLGWLMRGIESQLFVFDVTGTLDEPVFKTRLLSKLTAPVTGLGKLLSPLWGAGPDKADE